MSVKQQRSDADIDKHSYRRLAAAIILRAIRDAESCMPRIREDARMFLLSAVNCNNWSYQIFCLAGIDHEKTVNQIAGQQKILH
jgi:hypothetical protein